MNQSLAPVRPETQGVSLLLDGVELVIFDFDGVIADSEVISLTTLQATLKRFGMDLTFEEIKTRFLGKSMASISTVLNRASPKTDTEEFVRCWQSALFWQFRNELRPVPRVTNALASMSARSIGYCIASSSTFERIGVALEAMAMTRQFEHIYSAQLVKRGKPAPDLFLHAAENLGKEPESCLVVEDSPFGIQAAKAAGMRAIGFTGGQHLSEVHDAHASLLRRAGADQVIHSHDEWSQTTRSRTLKAR